MNTGLLSVLRAGEIFAIDVTALPTIDRVKNQVLFGDMQEFDEPPSTIPATDDGIMVLQICGMIDHRPGFMTWLTGGISCIELEKYIRCAAEIDSIKGLVLEIDSPGGAFAGITGVTKMLRELRSTMPVTAVINETALTAAYWIGSAASKVFIAESGMAGSLGLAMVHQEQSEADKERGITSTILQAGRFKAAGNDIRRMKKHEYQSLKARVKDMHRVMLADIAKNRRVSFETATNLWGNDAQTYIGKKAVQAKLADRLGTFTDAMNYVQARI